MRGLKRSTGTAVGGGEGGWGECCAGLLRVGVVATMAGVRRVCSAVSLKCLRRELTD